MTTKNNEEKNILEEPAILNQIIISEEQSQQNVVDSVSTTSTESTSISNDITKSSWTINYWNYSSIALGFLGAFGAGATTCLLHNGRKISQVWNLTNAICRAIFGTTFELSKSSFRNRLLLEIWKIVCNGSYIITTLDVNKLHTIFSDNYDYNIDEFPNLRPLLAFEISAATGALSGIIGLTKLLFTTEGSTIYKTFETIQKPLDFVCPALAAVGGGLLFYVPGLDSTIAAPMLCMLDGVSGTANFVLNQFAKKEAFIEINLQKLENNTSSQSLISRSPSVQVSISI